MRGWSAEPVGDVDRDVADQPHAAVGRVGPQRAPTRGRSGPGRRARRAPANAIQSSIQSAARSRNSQRLGRATPARAGSPSSSATPRTRTPTCTASRARRAARAAASATTSARPRRASRPRRTRPDRAVRTAAKWGAVAPRRYERGSCDRLVGYSTAEMPAPKRSEPPRRIRIAKPAPVLDGGRYAVKRTVGDTVAVSADIFRDGHEKLRRS